MIEALTLTLCLLMIVWGVAFEISEYRFNRDMQKILPRKEKYSLLETPWFSSGPPPVVKSDRPLTEEEERLIKEITDL